MNNNCIYTLGPEGTNGHRVALEVQKSYGHGTIVFVKTHDEIFARLVEDKQLSCGIVPIENSSRGLVSDVVDYWRYNKETPLQVIREISLQVRHHVLLKETTDLNNVKKIYSRPEALDQCRNNLFKRGFESVAVSSTSAGARVVLDVDEDVGALGSEFLACYYGLQVAIPDVQDFDFNRTRFHVISKTERPHNGDGRTAALFRVSDSPGSLVNFLHLFKEVNINISHVTSLPSRGENTTVFYCEIDAYALNLPMHDRVRKFTKEYRMIGSYDRQILD